MFLRWSSSSLSTAHAIGIIMAAQAVLLSHIDMKQVTIMNPNKILYTNMHTRCRWLKVKVTSICIARLRERL